MEKALTTVFAALAACALTGCLGGGMVVDASEPPDTDTTETDTSPTEATPFSGSDPAKPFAPDLRDQIAAAKAMPVQELTPILQTR